jgi:predicted phosphodiesterase
MINFLNNLGTNRGIKKLQKKYSILTISHSIINYELKLMKRLIVIIVMFSALSSSGFVLGQTGQGITNEDLIVTHGPYLQNMGLGGVTIIWTTNKPAVPGIFLSSGDGNYRFIRNSYDGIVNGGGTLHKIRIEGLEPGVKYNYKISSVQILKYQAYKIYYGDTLTGKAVGFSTMPLKPEKINFGVINDVHENAAKLASYLKRGKTAEEDLFFFNGDMVDYLQDSEQLFKGFIDTASVYFAAKNPFWFIRGNHETRGFIARDLKSFFDYKDDRFYYSFDMGTVHFVVLDCGEDKPDNNRYYYGLADYDSYRLAELEWLKNEVKSYAFKNASRRIVMVHMPIIKENKQAYGMKFLADHFGPVLQNTGIDLMISAHTHRTAYYEPANSGFGYPVLVNSNNTFVEVSVDLNGIKAIVKDVNGSAVLEKVIK